MGWFSGPTIKERSRGGRVEYYGKCEECEKEKSDTDKRRCERQLEACAKSDKDRKRKEDKDAADKARDEKQEKEKREREARAEEVAKIKKKLIKKAKEARRDAKGKCAFCGKDPCAGTNRRCAMVKAQEFQSAHDIDVSDPATFYQWAKDWKNI